MNNNNQKGFTLLEVLLVIAIIAILAGIVILALNPSKQLADARNSQRRVDVGTVLNAVYQYTIDNRGNLPTGIDSVTTTSQVLGTSSTGCDTTCSVASTTASCLDLSSYLVPTYIVDIPYDPSSGSATNTEYYLNKKANGRLVVGACDAEESETIEITR